MRGPPLRVWPPGYEEELICSPGTCWKPRRTPVLIVQAGRACPAEQHGHSAIARAAERPARRCARAAQRCSARPAGQAHRGAGVPRAARGRPLVHLRRDRLQQRRRRLHGRQPRQPPQRLFRGAAAYVEDACACRAGSSGGNVAWPPRNMRSSPDRRPAVSSASSGSLRTSARQLLNQVWRQRWRSPSARLGSCGSAPHCSVCGDLAYKANSKLCSRRLAQQAGPGRLLLCPM
jgi:hypothetical protein